MKRLLIVFSVIISLLCAGTVFAADPSQQQQMEAADVLDIGNDTDAGYINAFTQLQQAGTSVFDTAGLLPAEDREKLEAIMDGVDQKTGWQNVIVTASGLGAAVDIEDLADLLYYEGDLGTGADKSGTMLLIVPGEGLFIYPHGEALRYVTDSALNFIFDEYNGGLYNRAVDGDYSGACAIYADALLELHAQGIHEGQEIFNSDTGESDVYTRKKMTPFKALLSLIISAISAILPVNGVKKQYAMTGAKRLEKGLNLAYRASSVFNLAGGTEDTLINRFETTAPIPVKTTQSQSRGSGSGFGGGRTTVHSGRGGSVHGGGGRKL